MFLLMEQLWPSAWADSHAGELDRTRSASEVRLQVKERLSSARLHPDTKAWKAEAESLTRSIDHEGLQTT